MYQHEKVCQSEIPEMLDPICLKKLPFFTPNGKSVKLIDFSSLTQFYNKDPDYEEEKLNITLGQGFRVCIIEATNHVLIVGGAGSENSTFLFDTENNIIKKTEWKLSVPRVCHSL